MNFKLINNNLEKKGYHVEKNFLSKKISENLHEKINKVIKKTSNVEKKSGMHNRGSFMAYNLQNKDIEFLKLIFNKKILKIAENFFKNGSYKDDKFNFQFDNISGRKLVGTCDNQPLHIDSRICGVYPPTSMQFLLYLNDTKITSGATQVVPKSHKLKRYPTKNDLKKAIKILGKKGTLIIINSAIWHGSSKKEDIDNRTAIILCFNRWFLRQKFSSPYSLPKKFYSKLSKSEKMIFGFNNYPTKDEKNGRLRMRGALPKF